MADYREAFIGIDVAKLRNAVAVADARGDGEIRYLGVGKDFTRADRDNFFVLCGAGRPALGCFRAALRGLNARAGRR